MLAMLRQLSRGWPRSKRNSTFHNLCIGAAGERERERDNASLGVLIIYLCLLRCCMIIQLSKFQNFLLTEKPSMCCLFLFIIISSFKRKFATSFSSFLVFFSLLFCGVSNSVCSIWSPSLRDSDLLNRPRASLFIYLVTVDFPDLLHHCIVPRPHLRSVRPRPVALPQPFPTPAPTSLPVSLPLLLLTDLRSDLQCLVSPPPPSV